MDLCDGNPAQSDNPDVVHILGGERRTCVQGCGWTAPCVHIIPGVGPHCALCGEHVVSPPDPDDCPICANRAILAGEGEQVGGLGLWRWGGGYWRTTPVDVKQDGSGQLERVDDPAQTAILVRQASRMIRAWQTAL